MNVLKQGNFARFMIFCGKPRQAEELAMQTGKEIGGNIVPVTDMAVSNIRDIINEAYTTKSITTYILINADTMSNAAKNSLLKVTEEPPNKAYFILTIQDISTVLDTIRSRARLYQLEPYKYNELKDYANKKYPDVYNEDILQIAETPDDIDMLVKYGIEEFISFLRKVLANVATVSGANVFKIADKISLKADDNKYDLRLFLQGFSHICADELKNTGDVRYYASAVIVTHYILKKLSMTKLNKQMLFDKWLLDIRQVWME